MGAEAKNLEAISKAIDQHNAGCPFPAAEVRMNPFEAERLGWEEIRGLPIVPDPELGTGRFRIVCSRDLDGAGIEETEAIGEPVEVGEPVQVPVPVSRDNSDRILRCASSPVGSRHTLEAGSTVVGLRGKRERDKPTELQITDQGGHQSAVHPQLTSDQQTSRPNGDAPISENVLPSRPTSLRSDPRRSRDPAEADAQRSIRPELPIPR